MITYKSNLPPVLLEMYNPNLLLSYIDMLNKRMDKFIIPLSQKKIRAQDTGKRKQFDKLMKEFLEVYEQKKNDQAKYDAETEKKMQERSRIPNAQTTCTFNRMATKK